MPSVLENQKNTAKASFDAYAAWDIDGIFARRSSDCIQQLLPKSLNRPGLTNDEYRNRIGSVLPFFKDLKLTMHTILHDAESHAAAMHVSSKGSTPLGDQESEYMFMLHFTDDGTQIKKVEEFVDSAHSIKFFGDMQRHLAEHGKEA